MYVVLTHPDRRVAYWLSTANELTAVDLDTGEIVEPPRSLGSSAPMVAAFNPDGTVLAVGDTAGVRLYDLATATQIGPLLLNGTSGQYTNLEWAADGTRLITSNAGVVTSWDMDPTSWARRACAMADRNLTEAEWAQYLPAEPYRATCPDESSAP